MPVGLLRLFLGSQVGPLVGRAHRGQLLIELFLKGNGFVYQHLACHKILIGMKQVDQVFLYCPDPHDQLRLGIEVALLGGGEPQLTQRVSPLHDKKACMVESQEVGIAFERVVSQHHAEQAVSADVRRHLGLRDAVNLAIVKLDHDVQLPAQRLELEQTVEQKTADLRDQGDKGGSD